MTPLRVSFLEIRKCVCKSRDQKFTVSCLSQITELRCDVRKIIYLSEAYDSLLFLGREFLAGFFSTWLSIGSIFIQITKLRLLIVYAVFIVIQSKLSLIFFFKKRI